MNIFSKLRELLFAASVMVLARTPEQKPVLAPVQKLREAFKVGYIGSVRAGKYSKRGPVRPAGAKLARKAAEGKLGGYSV